MKFYQIPISFVFSVCSLFPAAHEHNPLKAVYRVEPTAFDAHAVASIERAIGYTFNKKSRLEKAFTTESKNPNKNLEIYEYKGDAVLKLAQSELIHKKFPNATPHERTQVKCAIESTEPLCALGVRLGLHKYVQATTQNVAANVIEDVIEALVWALYKDGGKDIAERFISRFFYPMIKDCAVVPCLPHQIAAKANRNKVSTLQYQGATSRIDRYNTAVQYVREHLPEEYQQRLITWPLDSNYKPFEESLRLDVDWLACSENACARLQNLCAMMGVVQPDYTYEKMPDGMFVSTMNSSFGVFKDAPAATKKRAQEHPAREALQRLQCNILLPQLLHINLNDLTTLYKKQTVQDLTPKSKINNLCQRFNLQKPSVDVHIRAGAVSEPVQYYAVAQAPWLPVSFESPIVTTRACAESEVYKKVAKCLYRWKKQVSRVPIKPATLMLIHCLENGLADGVKSNKELMNILADKLGKEQPSMKMYYADSSLENYPNPLFECWLSFEDITIKSEPRQSIQAAEEDAASQFLAKWLRETKQEIFTRI